MSNKCGMCLAELATVTTVSGLQYTCNNQRCPEYKRYWNVNNPQSVEPARAHGVKLDQGKPPVYTEFLMQFPRAIRLIARVGEKGTQAPGHVRSGWKSVDRGHERYSDAFGRHILKEILLATEAEPVSPDPMHDLLWEAATVAWNDLARLEHLIRANPGAAERLDGDPLA